MYKFNFQLGEIIVHKGFDSVFDEASEAFEKFEQQFEDYRKQQEQVLNTKNITYRDMGKDLFMLEIPSKVKVPKEWKLISKTQVPYSLAFI